MKLDHVALQVEDPVLAANWYKEKFDADVLYCDGSWSFVQLDNIKIAFVLKTQHPAHIAFEVDEFRPLDKVKQHRDGSSSIYKRDPWGNIIEYIRYPKEEDGEDEDKRQGVWGRVWRKLQNWRSCYVDGRIRVTCSIREKRKTALRTLNRKKNKRSRGKASLLC